jgi:hypothetical protein
MPVNKFLTKIKRGKTVMVFPLFIPGVRAKIFSRPQSPELIAGSACGRFISRVWERFRPAM